MTLAVHSLNGSTNYVPYYRNMRLGQFVTQIVAPAIGCPVSSETGDVVHNRFVLNGRIVFCKDNKDKLVGDVMQEGDKLYHTLNMGRSDNCLAGNGSLKRPTVFQLTLTPSVALGVKAEVVECKKRKA